MRELENKMGELENKTRELENKTRELENAQPKSIHSNAHYLGSDPTTTNYLGCKTKRLLVLIFSFAIHKSVIYFEGYQFNLEKEKKF